MFIEGGVNNAIDRPTEEKQNKPPDRAERLRGKIMMNFRIENVEYNSTESGRFYRTENGKKVRISKADFDTAWNVYTCDKVAEMTEEELLDKTEEETAKTHIENAEKAIKKALKDTKVQKDPKKSEGTKEVKEKAPKAKKVPEGGAEFEVGQPPYSETVILTAKQIDFIRHLPDTCYWENGLESCIWVDCLCDEIGGQFAGKPMTVGAMISTLCEKKLGYRMTDKRENRKCTAFGLTDSGKLVAQSLGLK